MNYKALKISAENMEREKKIIEKISQCISDNKSWLFDAGAGAGKTYALIQTLKLIVNKESKNLKKKNQKILCITYTNIAAKEIKGRVGATTLIEITTIHDCVWKIISQHQKQLVKIHYDTLIYEVSRIESLLQTEIWAKKYLQLSEENKLELRQMMNDRRSEYYIHKPNNAVEFKLTFEDINNKFPDLLSNVSNFKKIVDSLFKIQKYEDTIAKIDEEGAEFSKVIYDARLNEDRLEKMRISHDTLLDYTQKIVSTNDILKQYICDQYPFVLVDEYQDTSELVIKTLSLVDEYAKKILHPFIVGYYGDIKQNIYENGVGSDFQNIHKGLKRIEKVFNRRCSPHIIAVANVIRNDGLVQESIYDDFPDSDVEFYNMKVERKDFISAYSTKWNISNDNKLHCLELTNEEVAEQSGFSDIYAFFKNSKWYKQGTRFNLLRDQILSLDENKLGVVQKVFFRIVDFKFKVGDKSSMLLNVFEENNLKNRNITNLRKIVEKMQQISGETIGEYLENVFSKYKKGDGIYDKCVEYILAEDIKSFDELRQFVLNKLYYFLEGEEELDEDIKLHEQEVEAFFKISMKIFEKWQHFITDTCPGKVEYHTYHGTKGREFDNVIIFMNARFGRKANFFSNLFMALKDKNEPSVVDRDLEAARNLLYVAVTRATKNLCIVYLDDIKDVAVDKVQAVFGEIKYEL